MLILGLFLGEASGEGHFSGGGSPPQGVGEEKRKSKSENVGWDKNSLRSEGEIKEERKEGKPSDIKAIYSPPAIGRQSPDIDEHDVKWYGISLRLARVICLSVCPPNLLRTSSLFTGDAEWETEDLDALQMLFSNSWDINALSALF